MWIDDVRPAPKGYRWIKTVNEAKMCFKGMARFEEYYDENHQLCCIKKFNVEVIDIDHDAGDYGSPADGGDYIEFLNWLEYNAYVNDWIIPPIKIHSMNPVGVQKMKAIIKANGWTERID
jgi:hypothetical protein